MSLLPFAGPASSLSKKPVSFSIPEADAVAQKLRQESLALQRQVQLLELAHDAILFRDTEGRITFWNTSAEQIYQFGKERALGQVSHELLKTEFPEPISVIMETLFREGKWQGELTHTRADGAKIIVDSRWAIQAGTTGEEPLILEINRDVTDQRRSQEALKRRQDHLESALLVSGAGTYRWNLKTDSVSWDESLHNVFGLLPGQTVSCLDDFIRFVHPDDRAAVLKECATAVGQRRDIDLEYRIIRPDGAVRLISARGRVPALNSFAADEIYGACIDITRQRGTEDKLRQVEAQHRVIIDNLPIGVWMLDGDGRAVFGNKAGQDIWGGAQLIRNRAPDDFVATLHETGERLKFDDWAGIVALREGRKVLNQVLDVQAFDGERRTILQSAAPVFSEGRAVGAAVFTLDITDQARAQAALRANEARFRAIFETAAVGIAILDARGRWLEMNDTGCAMLGYSREELLALSFADITHPDDLAADLSQADRVLAGQLTTYSIDKRYLRKDGSVCWANLTVSAIQTEGQEHRFLSVIVDISERKQAEFVLRESRERLAAALSASQTGTFIWDIPTNTLQWDQELNRLFGLSLSKTARDIPEFFALVHPDDRARIAEACERCTRFGHDFHEEFRVTWPDGSIHWLEDKGKTFFGPDGKPVYMTGACVDVTARKKSEQAIRVARERFELVRRVSGVGFWFCDLPFGRLDWDHRVKEHFGLPPDAAVTIDTFYERIHPEDRERTRRAVEIATTRNEPYDIEYRTVGVDGSVRWIRAIGTAYLSDNGGGRFDGITVDITENVVSRELLQNRRAELEHLVAQRTSKLQETVEELEKFSYSISHDLRAPLRSMQSFAYFVGEDFGEILPEEGKEYLRRIITAAERMDRLIQDVLSYSRLSRTDIPLRPISLRPLIQSIVETYPQFHDHLPRIHIAPTLPTVRANEAALTQVISNLLGNAIKFSRDGAELEVRIWAEVDGGKAKLYVADKGIGIAPAHFERIFGVFQQIGAVRGGTGIGLAIVKKAVERMNGQVGVVSQPGHGSTFWFTLPLENHPFHDR